MKAIEDDLGLRKEAARSALIGWTHVHADKSDLFGPSPVGHQRLGEGFYGLRRLDQPGRGAKGKLELR
jgi:hypothetical protein